MAGEPEPRAGAPEHREDGRAPARRMSISLVLVAIVGAVITSYIAVGIAGAIARPGRLAGAQSVGFTLEPLSRDGWVAQEAMVELPPVGPFQHELLVSLESWHPAGTPEPVLVVDACGSITGPRLIAGSPVVTVRIQVPAGCSHATLGFRDALAVPGDDRALGAKLSSIALRGPFGSLPVFLPLTVYVRWFVAALLLMLAVAPRPGASAARRGIHAAAGCSLAVAGLLAVGSGRSAQLAALTIASSLVLLGWRIARALQPGLVERTRSSYFGPLLVGIVCVGVFFRCWGLGFGLPAFYHPDEGVKVRVVQRMLQTGSLNPQYFLHPTQLLYLTALVGRAQMSFGALATPQNVVFAGRAVSCAAGVASIVLLALIGRRLINRHAGLVAASLLAVSPLHVTCSRYLKEDALLLFWVLAATLAAVIALQTRSAPRLILAGALSGLAMSAKYTGLLSLAAVVVVPFATSFESGRFRLQPDRRLLLALPLAFLAAAFTFFLSSPFVVLDAARSLRHVQTERTHMLEGHRGVEVTAGSQLWTYHLERSLLPALGSVALVGALAGLGALIAIRPGAGLVVLGLFCLFYAPAEWVRAKPPPQPERYALLALPALALAAGALSSMCSRQRLVGLVLPALMVIPPAVRTFSLARDIAPDTRLKMAEWIQANVPSGTKILLDGVYSPRLRGMGFETRLLRADLDPRVITLESLEDSGFELILVTSFTYGWLFDQPRSDALLRRRYARIFSALPLVHEERATSGTYGFHNPVVRLYALRRGAGAPDRVLK